jgi:uncharacterized HAD superfamily protein
MTRQAIAIDIDDVIADQAEAFIAYSNEKFKLSYTVDDYTEHWMELWNVDLDEVERRAREYHSSGIFLAFNHKPSALPVLKRLKTRYDLVLVTSRRAQVQEETLEWVNEHFPDIFTDVIFAGFYDKLDKGRWHLTKADICKEIDAQFLIDDQLKHCIGAAEAGIQTILFGDYPWNQLGELPKNVSRCKDWDEVEKYFAGQS